MSDQPLNPSPEANRYSNLSAAFKNDPDEKNEGWALIRQQIIGLFMKRVRILGRRYVIAVCTLLLPVVLEAVLSGIIPSSAVVISDAINSIFGIRNISPFEFDLYKYGPQVLPVNTNNSQLYGNFSAYLDRQALLGQKNRNNLQLVQTNDVDSYVYAERKANIQNIIGKYYFGLDLTLDSSRDEEIMAQGYFSTFPYHTSASLLNEIDSFMFAYHSRNFNRSITTVNSPVSVALVQNFSGFDPTDLNLFTCIEGIPFSFLDIINGIKIIYFEKLSSKIEIRVKGTNIKTLV